MCDTVGPSPELSDGKYFGISQDLQRSAKTCKHDMVHRAGCKSLHPGALLFYGVKKTQGDSVPRARYIQGASAGSSELISPEKTYGSSRIERWMARGGGGG